MSTSVPRGSRAAERHGVSLVDRHGITCLCEWTVFFDAGGWLKFNEHIDAALRAERLAVVEEIKDRLPEDWREQLEIINRAAGAAANAEQITLLDLSNKALRMLSVLDEVGVAGLTGEQNDG